MSRHDGNLYPKLVSFRLCIPVVLNHLCGICDSEQLSDDRFVKDEPTLELNSSLM
jgi:hypothetical protein